MYLSYFKSDSEEDEWVEKNPKGVKDDVSAGNVQVIVIASFLLAFKISFACFKN